MGSTILRDGRTPLRSVAPPLANRETFDMFTTAARQVMRLAHQEAHTLGRDYVGTEHLVLALVANDGGPLGALGVRRAAVLASITRLTGPPALPGAGVPPMTPVLRRVLDAAAADARRLGDSAVRPEHMVIAVADERTCMGARVLAEVGVESVQLHRVLCSGT